jgi:hypothetical protein
VDEERGTRRLASDEGFGQERFVRVTATSRRVTNETWCVDRHGNGSQHKAKLTVTRNDIVRATSHTWGALAETKQAVAETRFAVAQTRRAVAQTRRATAQTRRAVVESRQTDSG